MKRATLTPSEAAFVEEQRVGRLATVSAAGNPHLVPVCYAFDGAAFYTPLDEKLKQVPDAELRRVRNIEENPRVALLVDRYEDDWSQLGYVLVRGTARLLRPENPTHEKALALLRERYPQYRSMNLKARALIAITPERVTSWGPDAGVLR